MVMKTPGEPDMPVDLSAKTAIQILCTECRRPWLDPHEHWPAYTADEQTSEPKVGFYCPACGQRCFDS
jgi:hypothetical protein